MLLPQFWGLLLRSISHNRIETESKLPAIYSLTVLRQTYFRAYLLAPNFLGFGRYYILSIASRLMAPNVKHVGMRLAGMSILTVTTSTTTVLYGTLFRHLLIM